MKRIFVLAVSSIVVFVMFIQCTTEKRNDNPFGVNMAVADFGSVFPGEYNTHYTYPTKDDLIYWHEKNLRLIRLPFKWERLQHELDGDLVQHDLLKMKEFVQAAEELNMPVILDLHNYCRRFMDDEHVIIGTNNLTVEHLSSFWKKIAVEFKDFTNIYGYGLMNEPHDLDEETTWFEMAQSCIDSIRTVDTENCILIAGDRWSSAKHWRETSDDLRFLVDPSDNLCFEAHCYFDIDGSGTYKNGFEGDEGYLEKGVDLVEPFVTWIKEHNLRGFVGEYGIPDDDERWNETMDLFLAYLQENGINGAYWAAGPWWPKDNFMAVTPVDGQDRPQMKVLEKYMYSK